MQRVSEQDKLMWRDSVPKIVVCGLKRSGKSSILRVLFSKLSPHEAGYIEPTQQPYFLPQSGNPLLNCRIAEIPGSFAWDDSEELDQTLFAQCQSLILVIDSSADEVPSAVYSLAKRVISRATKTRRSLGPLYIHLFLNKVDANYRFDPDTVQAESNKAAFVQAMLNKVSDEVRAFAGTAKIELDMVAHCTSIFDNSIHDAFSKVVQRPLLANGKVEQALDLIVSTCRLEKAVLFDLGSKITFGSDTSQIDASTFALMHDLLEVIIDMIGIYGTGGDTKTECNIALSNGEVIYVRLIGKNLALVSIIKADNFDKTYLLNHNVAAFNNALMKIVSLSA